MKKWTFYCSIFTMIALLCISFNCYDYSKFDPSLISKEEVLEYTLPSLDDYSYIPTAIPFTGKFFVAFKEALGFKESNGKYNKVNTLGYMGKYQFGTSTLKTVGIYDSSNFLNNPRLQEKAFIALIKRNKSELKSEIKKFSGRIVSGVKVTESGILAAAHLGGPGSVKKFLNSNGKSQSKDAYGTSVKSYMKKFGGYETKGIKAEKNARVSKQS